MIQINQDNFKCCSKQYTVPQGSPRLLLGPWLETLGEGVLVWGVLLYISLIQLRPKNYPFFFWGPGIIFYSLIFHRPQCFAPSGGALPSYWGGCRLALQRGGRRPAVGAGGGGGQAGSHRGPATRDNGRLQHSVGQVPDEGRSHPVAGWRGSIGVVCVAP